MNIYNFKNIDLDNIKKTNFDVDTNKKLYLKKLLRFLKIYELYDYYRNNLYNHPSFSTTGTNIGTDSLFSLNNIPNTISETFSSINEDNFKYSLINNIMLQNAILDIQSKKDIDEKLKIQYITNLEDEIKKISANLLTDVNNILSDNHLFIPIFDNSQFFVFITNDDYHLLLFIRNLIDYFLATEKTDYKIHYDIINSEILSNFSTEVQNNNWDELIFTIQDGINSIPFIYDVLFQKGIEKKYLGISVILYIIYFNIGLYYSLVKNYNLYGTNLENSKIFI